ncbi:putative transmembrane emp24 domain-containing protein [Dioscorea sansibarensis]
MNEFLLNLLRISAEIIIDHLQVTTPYGTIIHHKRNATEGEFAFTTTDSGNYQACFSVDISKDGGGANVNLDWKIGIAARDWASVARKEKIEVIFLSI